MYNKICEVLKQSVENGVVSGANVLVRKDGKEVAYCDYGFKDLENRKSMTRDTIFRMYSSTKPITAAAAMLLVSRGMLDLAEDISAYLPEFRNPHVNVSGRRIPAARGIMVKDLLNMTSGLPYPDETTIGGRQCEAVFNQIDKRLYSDAPVSTREFARMMAENDLCFEPGEQFMYGVSADILGAIIEHVAGMRLGEFLQKEFFEPLEMQDTGFYVPREKAERVAKVYDCIDGCLQEVRTNHLGIKYTLDVPPAFESGGAGLCSTLDDYAKFAEMLLHEGSYHERKIMPQGAVRYMLQGGLNEYQKASYQACWSDIVGYTYGNLVRVCDDESKVVVMSAKGEYGWNGWLGTFFSNEPAHGITTLIGVQRIGGDTGGMVRKIKNIVMCELT